jgi:hypothetical protein
MLGRIKCGTGCEQENDLEDEIAYMAHHIDLTIKTQ